MKKIIYIIILLFIPCVGASAQNGDTLQVQLQKLQQSINQSNQNQTSQPNQQTPQQGAQSPMGQQQMPLQSNLTAQQAPTQQQGQQAQTTGQRQLAERRNVFGDELSDEAFSRMSQTLLPLSPEQIRLLHLIYDANQHAASLYPGVPPKPISSSVIANLSPGSVPPVIRLGAGFVTSLVFLDSTGAPWPVASYSLGNPQAFDIKWNQKSNVLLVQAITNYRRGNIAVMLRGLNTPVMLEFVPGQKAMDVRVDVRVPGLGPDAKPSIAGLPGVASPHLLALLDGIPPSGSKSLKVSACQHCAWLYQGRLYLRTRDSVLSPAWISTLSSADGTHVYEMQRTPVILASRNGKMIKMTIQGF